MNLGEKYFTKLKGRWNSIVKPTKKDHRFEHAIGGFKAAAIKGLA